MKLNNFKNVTSLFMLLVFSSLVNSAPVLIPTSVALHSATSAEELRDAVSKNFSGGIGVFEVSTSIDVVTFNGTPEGVVFESSASTSVDLSATSVTVSGSADGGRYFRLPDARETVLGGVATALVSFSLVSPGAIDFQWATNGGTEGAGGRVSIVNSAGTSFLFCTYTCYNDNPRNSPATLRGDAGSIFLNNGDYTLSVITGSFHAGPGVDVSGVSSLSLTGLSIVPVPAAVWLFSSGLIGLLCVRKKSKNNMS